MVIPFIGKYWSLIGQWASVMNQVWMGEGLVVVVSDWCLPCWFKIHCESHL